MVLSLLSYMRTINIFPFVYLKKCAYVSKQIFDPPQIFKYHNDFLTCMNDQNKMSLEFKMKGVVVVVLYVNKKCISVCPFTRNVHMSVNNI